MTDDERIAISKALANLDIALVDKTPKAFMRVMVWQAREELRNITEDKMRSTSDCLNHERECGK